MDKLKQLEACGQSRLEPCRNAQSRSLLSRLNGEDQLAAGVAANAALESLARLSEREHGRHDWLDDAAIDQFFNLDELLPAWCRA